MPKPKAIALLRVSSAAQAAIDREGLPVQRETCQRIAIQHGLEIVEWVELEGVSGAAVLGDPSFAALLQQLRSPEINAVIVAAFDRLFRLSRFADYSILDSFSETGTRLLTANGELDLRQDSDGLLGVLHGYLGGMERRAITERTKAGRRRKRRERGVRAEGPVGMPRGVTFDYTHEKWAYEWPEAEKVREAFRLYLAGIENFREIHRRTGIGSEKDASSSIARVLRQPLYAGIYRVDRIWDGGHATPLPPEQVQEHKVLDPPLVPLDDWHEVQRRLDLRARARPERKDPETLGATYTGHLVCSRCNRPMRTPRDSRGYVAYGCERRSGCSGGQVSVRAADPWVDTQLEAILGDLDTLQFLIDETTRGLASGASPSVAELSRQTSALQNKERRVREAYEAGDYELDYLRKRQAEIAAEKAALEALMDTPGPIEIDADVMADLVEVWGSWSDLAFGAKRALLREYQLEIIATVTGRPKHRRLKVERIRFAGLPPDVWLYK
jgi:DNA invertase Pin-like site-specific DNA recombinase